MESHIYNQVTLKPITSTPGWQPAIGEQFIYSKNGEEMLVVMFGTESENAIVTKQQLEGWLNKIERLRKLEAELEQDIGKVVLQLDKLAMMLDNPMKAAMMLPRLMSGKVNPKELGIDIEHLQAVGRKYAPLTVATLEKSKQQ